MSFLKEGEELPAILLFSRHEESDFSELAVRFLRAPFETSFVAERTPPFDESFVGPPVGLQSL